MRRSRHPNADTPPVSGPISEQLTLSELEAYMATGVPESATPQVRDYLHVLSDISTRIQTGRSQTEIINHLVLTYDISRRKAVSMYGEAVNYYYMDAGIKPRAIAALYADRLERLVWAVLTSNPSHDDIFKAIDRLERIAVLRGADRTDQDEQAIHMLPQTVVYTTDATQFGFPELGDKMRQIIASLPVSEDVKRQVSRQAGLLSDGKPVIPLDKPQ